MDLLVEQSPFLVHAIIALSALYMTPEDALNQNCPSSLVLSERHAALARHASALSTDRPSSMTPHFRLVVTCS